jgi:hypothetical protein
LTAGHRPAAGGASRRTRAAGQHQEGDREGEQSGRLHQAPVDPPMGDAAGRPADRRQRRQRQRRLLGTRRPASGLDGGGCGLG